MALVQLSKNKMSNFDLKKYLAEGYLFRIDEIRVRATLPGLYIYPDVMFEGEDIFDMGLDPSEIEWTLQNLLSKKVMDAEEFLKKFAEWWGSSFPGEGGDSEWIHGGLEYHVSQGLLTAEQAGEIMVMYWDDPDMDEETKEEILNSFK